MIAKMTSDLQDHLILILGYSPLNGKDLSKARLISLKRSERKRPVQSSVRISVLEFQRI
jgi:hypothetical protein